MRLETSAASSRSPSAVGSVMAFSFASALRAEMTWPVPEILLHGGRAPLPPEPASRGAKRINVPRTYSALSAPTQTTAQAADKHSAGFDFARAAMLLTDAACRAGAAIM